MSIEELSDKEKNKIIDLIKNDENLPKEYIYKLFSNDEDVFLFWNGRNEEISNIVLPFHSIEHIDEPRKEKLQGSGELFDIRGRQIEGWTNKLIWGDNKLILSSLVNGPLREEIEEQGGLKLIYIDPPFKVGADFSFDIDIQGENATKKQSVLEEIAYRDTWGRGISSYLNMMYERLKLMHDLLDEEGSIYVHCDYKVSAHLRILLDDIFGTQHFQNEIIWKRSTAHSDSEGFANLHDTIFYYTKSDKISFDVQYKPYSDEYIEKYYRHEDKRGRFLDRDLSAKGLKGGGYRYKWKGKEGYWRCPKTTMEEYEEKNRIYYTSNNTPRYKQYLDEMDGTPVQDIWTDINAVNSQAKERLNYPTQKPESLINRIIKTSTNEGDLVADFFCGSGTTSAVAEKLNRKWILSDLGRFAVHTTRKRMIELQRGLKDEGENYRAFELLNLGKYERQHFFGVPTNVSGDRQKKVLEAKQEKYVNLILEGFSAERVEGYKYLHGKRTTRFVHVGPLNMPVTRDLVEAVYQECKDDLITQVDILGFEFEMGLAPFVEEQMKDKGVDIRLKNIPREVFDPRAVKKGQVKFFDVAYLGADTKVNDKEVQVTLSNFVTSYTQDDIEDVENNLRKGSSKVIIDNGEIIKVTKEGDGIYDREPLTSSWTDWIDYWAVDFNYESNKEIIKVEEDGELKEKWTGNYIFENEWQSFRTKQDNELELTSAPHEYKEPGRYKIMVKVVDILGVDTSQVFEIEV
ncbi:site-specific DNA-methyltransferase [Fodinibius sediminis]|uniref:site-specific DNA-methyltransferase (adenine-specific) n=1 Tax=Fodinibius sediminis TaxID=1214077 RepID=A0A521FAF6_9BACT|nr:site-specific DNA-methyltransferase [Fodinibius sediminis]SMO92500.1 adenine-specific DNA-methyltransferase [Fodinibius sediminis]